MGFGFIWGLSASSPGNLTPMRRRWLSAVCDRITVISLWVVILQLVRYQFDFSTFRPGGPLTVILLYGIPAETINFFFFISMMRVGRSVIS